MKISFIVSRSIILLAIGLCFACLPSGPDYVKDTDIVYTTYDEDYDFDSKTTYSMPDKIVTDVQISREGDTTYVYMDDKYASPILAQVDKNMTDYGWTKVTLDQNPDMLMMPAGMSSTNYYYNWWYDWWWDFYYPYWWGWYYPPYYPVSSYTTGSMILVLTDPQSAQDNPLNKSNTSWLSVSNGILTYYNDMDRVYDAIDQSFEQSPYLKK
ncbi:DUF4136 domain-containing protein [Echinicola pacifica]|uniref:DUF4136 domain-containing protein n=1 Tax=Echinicola pacifica TaxID=346377 RepID=UPI00037EE182|nr:DUF4136 domain-containing protein [Echinicola pacifica]